MYYLSAIPDILPTKYKNVTMREALTCPEPSVTAASRRKPRDLMAQTQERTSGSMSKFRVKQQEDSRPPDKGEPSLDLIMLYEQYKRPIHTYVYRLLGNQEDADDLTQEVFVRAFVAWNDLYDHANLSPWLYRIATNLCVDQLRKRKRVSWWPLVRPRLAGSQFDHGTEEDASYLPSDPGGIPEIFEREHIRLALASMPEDYAIVLVLSAAQGVPYQDIAKIIDISPNAAATRISRAKRMFAEQYQRLNKEDASK